VLGLGTHRTVTVRGCPVSYLAEINAAIDVFEDGLDLDANDRDVKFLVELLADIRASRSRLHGIEAVVESYAARAMTGNRLELPGLLAERKGGAKRTDWDHMRLAGVVARRYATDVESGEVDPTLAELTEAVSRWLLEFAAIQYWRAGKLREVGIDPDGYATVERGRRTVVITRSEATP